MRVFKDVGELSEALVSNFRLKAKILSILFGSVLFVEFIVLAWVATQTDLPGKVVPIKMMVLGPMLLSLVFLSELLSFRYLKRKEAGAGRIKSSFIYISTFVEVSFPCIVMVMAGNILRGTAIIEPLQVINSPLLIMVFIMIVLSSLLLDPRLCFFAGLTAGIEYILISFSFLAQEAATGPVDWMNAAIKGVFLVIAGLIAGFVSAKVREAVLSSLYSKNELINNLDARVAEKTAELEKKNELLQEKQKEILDSIHYAKRIQCTLLPNEKYLIKTLEKLKKQ